MSPRMFMAGVLFILTWLPSSNHKELSCPSECNCSGTGNPSDVTVSCSSTSTEQGFPSNLPVNTQQLHLSNYSLLAIQPTSTLTSLKALTMNHCRGSAMKDFDFRNMPNLATLDLQHNHLDKMPNIQGTKIEYLHLGHNQIKALNMSQLGRATSLKELNIDHNSIESVHINAIFPNLEKLLLSNNNISDAKQAFTNLSYIPLLNTLSLANNSIPTIGYFPKLGHMQYLDLSNNSISDVEPNTFLNLTSLLTLKLQRNQLLSVPHGLPMLEDLDLSHNNIIHILESQKHDIYPIEVFNFAHNPLHCDCHILWLKELYDQREYLLKHITIPAEEFIPSCASPESLAGESWDQIGDAIITCDTMSKKTKGGKPDLVVKSGKVTGDTIEIYWSWTVKGQLGFNTVYIQYYVFGLRGETKRHIQVALASRQYTLKNLRPLSNYIVCVVPLEDDRTSSEMPSPQSLDDCLEISTKDGEPIQVLSLFYIVTYYFLGMSATLIAIFAVIGLIALLYGAYSSKSDWSAKYVPIDEPTDDESAKDKDGADNPNDANKVHKD